MAECPVTAEYIRRCLEPGSALRDAGRRAPFLPEFGEGLAPWLLPRPMFLPQSVVDSAFADLTAVLDAAVSVPARLFGGDPFAMYEAVNMPADSVALLRRTSGGPPPRYGRADMLFDGQRLRLIELNIGSELGGVQFGEMSRGLLAVPQFRDFAAEHRLSHVDTAAEIIEVLRRVAEPVTGGRRDPVVALVTWIGNIAALPALYTSFQAIVAAHGIELHLVDVTEVTERDGKLYVGATPVDVALRYFALGEVRGHPDGAALIEPILRAHERGGTVLFSDLNGNAYAYKDGLAFLSDPRYREHFTAEQAAAIDRLLPWSRRVVDETTDVDGVAVPLLDHCRSHRESLILKPHDGYDAAGTVAGWEASAEQWDEVLARSPNGEYIVQRRVDPQTDPVVDPQTGEVLDCTTVYGVFYTERGYGGMFNRVQGPGRTSVITRASGIGITSTFTYPG